MYVHIYIYSTYDKTFYSASHQKEEFFLFNDTLNTFYLRLYGITHMVKDHSERGNLLLPHGLLFPISSNGSFICIIPQTGYNIPQPLLHQLCFISVLNCYVNQNPFVLAADQYSIFKWIFIYHSVKCYVLEFCCSNLGRKEMFFYLTTHSTYQTYVNGPLK